MYAHVGNCKLRILSYWGNAVYWILSYWGNAVYSLGVPIDDGSFKCIQRCSGWAECFKWFKSYSLRLSCLNMISHFQCKLSTPKRWWIHQMSSKMQLMGCSRCHDSSEWFKWQTLTLPYHDIPFSIDYWQLACKLSSVYPQERRDPSNVFKDAVDELFQGFGNKILWHNFCLYLIGTLHIATDQGELVPEGGRVAFFLTDG